jgi:hypothetical protein
LRSYRDRPARSCIRKPPPAALKPGPSCTGAIDTGGHSPESALTCDHGLLAAANIVLRLIKAWWLDVRVFRAPASAPATTLVARIESALRRPATRKDTSMTPLPSALLATSWLFLVSVILWWHRKVQVMREFKAAYVPVRRGG